MKQLIITGDDFGCSPRINEAIERCHESGFLTHASLMVNEGSVEEAVRIARRHPRLCVGLHLALCAGQAATVSALTNPGGRFLDSPARAGLCYAFDVRTTNPLRAEIEAQFERFAALGFPATYLDGHTHLHLHPTVFRLALPALVQRGFGYVRLVEEPRWIAPTALIFRALSQKARRRLRACGLVSNERLFGFRDTGRMTSERCVALLARVPSGLSELYYHPGQEPGELDFIRLQEALAAHALTLVNGLSCKPPQSAD